MNRKRWIFCGVVGKGKSHEGRLYMCSRCGTQRFTKKHAPKRLDGCR